MLLVIGGWLVVVPLSVLIPPVGVGLAIRWAIRSRR